MSGIYIPGMEVPTEGFVEILIRDDGTVLQTGQSYRIDGNDYYAPYVGEMPVIYKAIPVPDHGDLIDRNTAIAACIASPKLYGYSDEGRKITDIYDALVATPTIIPADHIGDANEMVTDREAET